MAQVQPTDENFEEQAPPDVDSDDEQNEGGGGCCGGGGLTTKPTAENPLTKLAIKRLKEVKENFSKLFKFEKAVLDKKSFKSSQATSGPLVRSMKVATTQLKVYKKAKKQYDVKYRALEAEMAKPVPNPDKMSSITTDRNGNEQVMETERTVLHREVFVTLANLKASHHARIIKGLLDTVQAVQPLWASPAEEEKEQVDAEEKAQAKKMRAANKNESKLEAAAGKETQFLEDFKTAVTNGDVKLVKSMLKTHKACAKIPEIVHIALHGHSHKPDGQTERDAAEANRLKVLQLLIKSKADIHLQNSAGYTPLHLASGSHLLENPMDSHKGCPFIKTLLDGKANINATSDKIASSSENAAVTTPLVMAVNATRPIAVQYLVSRGANMDGHFPGTPLESWELPGDRGKITKEALTQARAGDLQMIKITR